MSRGVLREEVSRPRDEPGEMEPEPGDDGAGLDWVALAEPVEQILMDEGTFGPSGAWGTERGRPFRPRSLAMSIFESGGGPRPHESSGPGMPGPDGSLSGGGRERPVRPPERSPSGERAPGRVSAASEAGFTGGPYPPF